MAVVSIDREILYIERGRVWKVECGAAGILTAADHKVGIITGAQQVIVTNRVYGATASKLVVGLYEAAFTGGTDPRIINRRLSMPASGVTAVATVKEGVTATLGTVITQATVLAGASTGNAQAAFFGEGTAVILEPNTSYVVSLLNGSASAADIGMAFDMRADGLMMTINESH